MLSLESLSSPPINDIPGVEVVKGLHHAGGVETCGSVVKVAAISQDGPQFSAQTALHQHVQVFAIFERFEQFHDEVRVGLEAHRERGKWKVSRWKDMRRVVVVVGGTSKADTIMEKMFPEFFCFYFN